MGNFHIRRSTHKHNFITISKEILQVKTVIGEKQTYLSLPVVGLFLRLLTLKPGCRFTAKDLANKQGISIDTMRKYLKELETIGYLKTEYKTNGRQSIKHYFLQECLTEELLKNNYEEEYKEQMDKYSILIPNFNEQ